MAFSGNSGEKIFHNLQQLVATYCNQKFMKILLDAFSKTRKFLVILSD